MAHSRADIQHARTEFFTATDKVADAVNEALTVLKDLTNLFHHELAAIHNARRAVNMVMGEEPLELTDSTLRPNVKDLAAKMSGNGQ